MPHSEGSSAKGVGVKRGRSATEGRATIVKELERANELRMLKEARIEARYRLTNAVMVSLSGCTFAVTHAYESTDRAATLTTEPSWVASVFNTTA